MPDQPAASADNRPIALVVAMESELRHFLDRVEPVETRQVGPWLDRIVRYAGQEIVALCSGIGMVNAAAGAEHVIAAWNPRLVLNFGCAGAHRRDLLPGDVVIGAGTVHHGAVHILASGDEYFPDRSYTVTGETVASTELDADPRLLALAESAAHGWTPESWPPALGWPVDVAPRPAKVETGVVASADIWTQFHERLDSLHARHRSLCEDMEAAAIAQICGRHGVAFLTVKDISNNEFLATSKIQGNIDVLPASEIGKRAATLLLRVIGEMGGAV
jgi:adenosylhomocysteine nucleosidase